MAFRKRKTARRSFDSPEALFRDRRNRSVEGVLAHQADVLRLYQDDAFEEPNVAIELPTGSGKTLVGLLIAEFRRVTCSERVLYLCPTRQLVQQVVEQAERKYDIKATPFVGKVKNYDPSAKARYQTAETVAVAPYSALFNTNPFFDSPQLIILDDAHSAENYIASNWSVGIPRQKYRDLYLGLLDMFSESLDHPQHQRFVSDEYDYTRVVEKIPTAALAERAADMSDFLDVHTSETQLQYPWSLLRGHVESCHLYFSQEAALLRPYIPPSLTHAPFAGATQRVFMSATLGNGGDLERMTGVPKFHRIPIPAGWDKQGIGRRFFMFPELSLPPEEIPSLVEELIERAGRALILVPSDAAAERYCKAIQKTGVDVFRAADIEESKDDFVEAPDAVAILANRYDGIDLLGDECRLLIIEGLPKAGNLQERFLVSKMASSILLNDRIRTRIIQAVGRCTRSATDYAAVCVLGEDFFDWMILREKRAFFHPELHGELIFGGEQSKETTAEEIIENFEAFLEHGEEWESADSDIREHRDEASQAAPPGEELLLKTAKKEVKYQYALWNGDYEKCVELAEEITGLLTIDAVKGLRGFWYYLAGSAAALAAAELEDGVYHKKAAGLYARASACIPAMPWLRRLAADSRTEEAAVDVPTDEDELLAANVERMESVFDSSAFASAAKFEREVQAIQECLDSTDSKKFEEAHRRLGELLGFEAGNANSDAAPDPWWISGGRLCLVSEDKSDAQPDGAVAIRYARQAASHPNWIREHIPLKEGAEIAAVMITPQKLVHPEVPTYAGEVGWWELDDFRAWARKALKVLRRARSQFSGPGDTLWRAKVSEMLRQEDLDPVSIVKKAQAVGLAELQKSRGAGE